MERPCAAISIGLLAGSLHWMPGCKQPPPAAQVELVVDPAETRYARTVTPGQRAELIGAWDSLAAGRQASSVPSAAPAGAGRWSDVQAAVLYACDDIEAAIVSSRETQNQWEFRFRTVEDWPGTLVIRCEREDSHGLVYEATCEIGYFGDQTARAQALLAAFDKHLLAFGAKRQWSPPATLPAS